MIPVSTRALLPIAAAATVALAACSASAQNRPAPTEKQAEVSATIRQECVDPEPLLADLDQRAEIVPACSSGPSEVFEVRTAGQRYVVFLTPDSKDLLPCEYFRLGSDLVQATGKLWPGNDTATAHLVAKAPCRGDWCPATVTVHGANGKLLGAVPTQEQCGGGSAMEAVPLFADGINGLVVRCRRGAGSGYEDIVMLLGSVGGELRLLHQVYAGSGETPSLPEREDPTYCPLVPVGSVTVTKSGTRPQITVRDPEGERLGDGKGIGTESVWTWDPKQRRFTKTSEKPWRYDGRRCAKE